MFKRERVGDSGLERNRESGLEKQNERENQR